ncbi:hypothetical protein VNI00_019137 [Paramarasmius palmivorus]|uniref:Uncharacterized protein n=1 Tax=Paramarasmius palmivorus TaxID=297713 RepID=A0AAW0AR61_9AGAR
MANAEKTWFTDLEAVGYAFVEYIPLVGTIYSYSRTRRAYREGDYVREIGSVTNLIQGAIRDAVLLTGVVEPVPAVVVHAALEGFTDKLAEIWATGKVQASKTPDKNKSYVVFAGSTKARAEQTKARFTANKHLGIHHFHGSLFRGKVNNEYASNENLFVSFPDGISDKARCEAVLTWTSDGAGVEKRPEWTVASKMTLLGNNKFKVVPDAGSQEVYGFYHFEGEVRDKGQSIKFDIRSPKTKKIEATVTVERIT